MITFKAMCLLPALVLGADADWERGLWNDPAFKARFIESYLAETDIERWAAHRQFPIIPCTLCGSQENLQRKQVGAMLREWEKKHPGRIETMFNALGNVVPSHLMDSTRYDFRGLKATGVPSEDGDKAFDTEELASTAPTGLQIVRL